MNMSEVFTLTGMYHEAIVYMDSACMTPVDPVLIPYYYHLQRSLYGLMTDFAVTGQERAHYARLTQQYRDSIMSIHPLDGFLYNLVLADKLYSDSLYDDALGVLQSYESTHDISLSDMGVFAAMRAKIYAETGQRELEKEQLILSSVSDMRGAVREYISLRMLAQLLYEDGDIERAYTYVKAAVEDARRCHARMRTVETGSIYPIIESAYIKQEKNRKTTLVMLTVAVCIIVVLLVIMLLLHRREMHRLAQAQKQLQQANSDLTATNMSLTESNHIKEVYIGRYMEMCSTYIDRFDNYRRKLQKLAKEGKYDHILAVLKSQKETQAQLDDFYADFDEAFLTIFPDFVKKMLSLLQDGTELKIKKNEKLNTDLRVYALIRLGITDSTQIAHFLRYSMSTIYNSRTRMRNLAKGDRENFDKKVTTL